MTIRVSTIRNIGLGQPALPSFRPAPAVSHRNVDAGAVGKVQPQQDPTAQLVGKGFTALGEFIRKVDERKDEIELMRFGSALEQQTAGLSTQAMQEVERPSDAPRRYLELHNETTEQVLDQVEDNDVRIRLKAAAGKHRATEFARLIKQVDSEQQRRLNDEINARIDLKRQQAIEGQPVMGEIDALIERQQEHGFITESEAKLQKKEITRQVEVGQALRLIEADPAQASQALAPDGQFSNIDTETRIRLRKRAEREVESGQRALRSDIKGLIEDDIASRRATGEGIADMEAQVKALGDDELLQEYRKARKQAESDHAFVTEARFATQEEIASMLESRKPEPGKGFADKQDTFESLQKAASRMLKARSEDPFGYAAQDDEVSKRMEQARENPGLYESAVAANLSVQADMGIAPSARRVVSEAQAASMVAEINSAKTSERSQKLKELMEPYGKYQRRAMMELQRAGLEPQVFGLLNVSNEPMLASAMAEAQEVGRQELRNGMPDTFDFETFRANVQDKLADLQSAVESVPGRISDYNQTILEPMIDMAMVFERRGLDWEEGVDRFLNQLEIHDTFYIPKQIEGQPVSVAAVESATEFMQTEEKIREFRPAVFGGIPEGLNVEDAYEAVVSAAVDSGFWATNGEGDGLELRIRLNDGSSVPLVNNAGERYTVDMLDPPKAAGHVRIGEPELFSVR